MKKTLSLVLLMGMSHASFANTDTEALKQLFDSGQSVQAYELGLELQDANEGDPAFDYYFGASAIDAGDASLGVFALERVLIQQPDNHAARLELARGYFILEEYSRSRQEFETVLEASPPPGVKSKVEEYLYAIKQRESRYRSTSSLRFYTAFGQDSNANLATSETTLEFAGSTQLTPQTNTAQELDSAYNETRVDINYNVPLSSTFSLFGGGQLAATSYFNTSDVDPSNGNTAGDFNNISNRLNLGLAHRHGNHHFRYQVYHQNLILDSDFYRRLTGLNAEWQFRFSQSARWQTYFQAFQTDFLESSNPNTRTYLLGTGYLKQFNLRFAPMISASVYIGDEKPRTDTPFNESVFGKDIWGVNLLGQMNFTSRQSLRAQFSFQNGESDVVFLANPNLGTAPKEDDFLNIGLHYRYLLSREWQLGVSAVHSDNDSNVTQFSYDRERYYVSISYGN